MLKSSIPPICTHFYFSEKFCLGDSGGFYVIKKQLYLRNGKYEYYELKQCYLLDLLIADQKLVTGFHLAP